MKLSFLHSIVFSIINFDHKISFFPQQNDRETLFFRDGKRRIDLVLVYEDEDISLGVMTEQDTLKSLHRQQFLENLLQEGLEIELEDKRVMLFNNACRPCLWCLWPHSPVAFYGTNLLHESTIFSFCPRIKISPIIYIISPFFKVPTPSRH